METKNTLESLLADLLSKDATRIWSSACAVNTCFDRGLLLALSDHMDKIRAATANIALGGALHPNSEHLRNAIARMAFVREKKGCLCALYGIFDDPTREAEAGRVSISGTVLVDGGPYVDYYSCACLACGANWKVNEAEYHYTTYSWGRR